MAQDLGTSFSHGVAVTSTSLSAVSAHGPVVGRSVAVVALTVPSVLDNTSVDTTFALTGAAVGDPVIIGHPSGLSTGVHAVGFVSAADEITLRLVSSKGTVNQTAQTWSVSVMKRSHVTR
jgi:hypothetical protein